MVVRKPTYKKWWLDFHDILALGFVKHIYTPEFTKMTLEIPHVQKGNTSLHSWWIIHCHVSFQESIHKYSRSYIPKVQHGTSKWWSLIGISFSSGWFSGSMLIFRGVHFHNKPRKNVHFKELKFHLYHPFLEDWIRVSASSKTHIGWKSPCF